MGDFNFGTFNFGSVVESEPESQLDDSVAGKKSKRRSTVCTELSSRYEYRRAFSEVKMLEAMKYEELKN